MKKKVSFFFLRFVFFLSSGLKKKTLSLPFSISPLPFSPFLNLTNLERGRPDHVQVLRKAEQLRRVVRHQVGDRARRPPVPRRDRAAQRAREEAVDELRLKAELDAEEAVEVLVDDEGLGGARGGEGEREQEGVPPPGGRESGGGGGGGGGVPAASSFRRTGAPPP